MQGREGWREIWWWGGGGFSGERPEQCFLHEARSQARCVIQALSNLQLVPCHVPGTGRRESGVRATKVVILASMIYPLLWLRKGTN